VISAIADFIRVSAASRRSSRALGLAARALHAEKGIGVHPRFKADAMGDR
jgi:hypothetical protein